MAATFRKGPLEPYTDPMCLELGQARTRRIKVPPHTVPGCGKYFHHFGLDELPRLNWKWIVCDECVICSSINKSPPREILKRVSVRA